MRSSRSRDQAQVPCISSQILIHCATREVQNPDFINRFREDFQLKWWVEHMHSYIAVGGGALHWPRGILVPWPGIEPVPPAVETQSQSLDQGITDLITFYQGSPKGNVFLILKVEKYTKQSCKPLSLMNVIAYILSRQGKFCCSSK